MFVNTSRIIPVERERLFEFLSDLDNHWLLADGAISVVHVEPAAGGRAWLEARFDRILATLKERFEQ